MNLRPDSKKVESARTKGFLLVGSTYSLLTSSTPSIQPDFLSHLGQCLKLAKDLAADFGIEAFMPQNFEQAWTGFTPPGIELAQAQLIKSSTTIWITAKAYPETVEEYGIQYDLYQYLATLYAYHQSIMDTIMTTTAAADSLQVGARYKRRDGSIVLITSKHDGLYPYKDETGNSYLASGRYQLPTYADSPLDIMERVIDDETTSNS